MRYVTAALHIASSLCVVLLRGASARDAPPPPPPPPRQQHSDVYGADERYYGTCNEWTQECRYNIIQEEFGECYVTARCPPEFKVRN
ncbi:hypothetical protein ACCO45_005906 [Purpureocillium lilacinum]|uniref:Uncharacterized protein n=1 Tax=Purpureocillium lilacinum TaxID=33203 RepID=A0ACC4DY39_PURLI